METNKNLQHSQSIWTTYNCDVEKTYLWHAGPLQIWLQKSGFDWLIDNKRAKEDSSEATWEPLNDKKEDADWKRWILDEKDNQVEILPVMANRPLVVKTKIRAELPPGVKAKFYVNIPISVRLSVSCNNKLTELTRIPTVELSNTWFGDHFKGELCYALKTRAVRSLEDTIRYPHRALCGVIIQNQAEIPLPIDKICIRAKHLNIYMHNQQLWTNQVNVTFRGEGLTSKVEYEKQAPNEAPQAIIVSPAEEKPQNNFLTTLGHNFLDIF